MQVVTSQNIAQLIETGSVPEYVPPGATAKEPVVDKTSPERGADGKFVAANTDTPLDKADEKVNVTDTPQGGEDDDKDLPERVRQQIGKKHRQWKEAEEFGERQFNERRAAEQRADDLKRELEEIKAKSRPAAEPAKEPVASDFATVAEYAEALATFKVDQKWQQKEAEQAQHRADEEKATATREYGERLARTRLKFDDFDKVVRTLEKEEVSMQLIEYLQEAEHGPELLYNLAKQPDELARLKKLSPRKAIAELGKLELKLEKPAATPTPPAKTPVASVSQAPAPIAPLDGKSAVVEKDPAKMNFQEYREYERNRTAQRRR